MGSYPACLLFVVYNSPNITLTSFHPNKPQSAEARTPAAAPIRDTSDPGKARDYRLPGT